MRLAQIETLPRILSCRCIHLAITTLLSLGSLACQKPPQGSDLQVFPKHFVLHPGEQIHYQVRIREGNHSKDIPDYKFSIEDPEIVRPVPHSKGALFIEALRPGRTELAVRTPTSETRIDVEVAGSPQPLMMAVPHSTVKEIKAKELLFVGHANLDGFDHTAVAKAGIDSLVQEAKKNGVPVVYFVSEEYPNWYTADRNPDYAIISEGQEHEMFVDAERVMFAGGDYMACTLRNVQMTLHGMVKHGKRRINFVFPAQGIWVQYQWWPGEKRPYPAPMLTLNTVFARHGKDAQAYDEVIVPFIDRVINQFPIWGYPPIPPAPPLSELLKDWTIAVHVGSRFERVYRHGDPNKTIILEFQGL